MKKYVLFLLIISSFKSYGQYDYDHCIDSVLFYNWENETWDLDHKIIFDNTQSNILKTNRYNLNEDNEIESIFFSEFHYDNNGNNVLYTVGSKDIFTCELRPAFQFQYEYDNLNNLTLSLYTSLEEGEWVNKAKDEFIEFDEFNNVGKTLNYSWEDDDWVLVGSREHERFYLGNLLDSLITISLIPSNGILQEWQWNSSKFNYDSNDLLVSKVNYGNTLSSEDIRKFRTIHYSYNSENRLAEEEETTFEETGNSYINTKKFYSYLYDDLPFTEQINQHILNSSLTNHHKWQWFYKLDPNSSNDLSPLESWEEKLEIQNLSSERICIKLSELASNSKYKMNITDASGRVVKLLTIENKSDLSIEYSLAQGQYYVSLMGTNGHRIAKAFVSL